MALRSFAPGLEWGAMAALTLLGATFALESTRPILNLKSVVLTNVELLLFLSLGLWLTALAAAQRRPHLPRRVALPAAAWLTALLLSALFAPSHQAQALKFFGRMAVATLLAWAAYDLSRLRNRWSRLARALALGGLLTAVLGLAEATGLPGVERFLAAFKQGHTVVGEVLRVSSTLEYATIASMVLELTVPLTLGWVLTAERRWFQVLLGTGLVAMLAAQTLTLTRGGLLSLLAALVCMAAWAAWRHRRVLLWGSLITAGTLLALWGASLIWNPVARYRLVSETEQRWYQAAYQAPAQLAVDAGEMILVPVTVTNTSVRPWKANGDHAFRLGFHLAQPDGTIIRFEGEHVALPRDLPAGEKVLVWVPITAPGVGGQYVLEWDMVQEGVTWFAWQGTASGRTLVRVTGTAARSAVPPYPAPGPPVVPLEPEDQGRLWLWRLAAGMVAERPLFGVGPDNFRWLHGAHAGLEQADTRVHANNLYIEWLVDTGLVGFAAFLWLTWALGRAAYDSLVDDKGAANNPVWQVAVVASLVAWFAHGAMDFFYEFTPTYVAFALLCGLALATSPFANREGRQCASDST
jgi:hypothetical protein